MSYNYLTQWDSPNYTPANQTRATWGVDRDIKHIIIHWWGDPNQNPSFEGIVNTLINPANGRSAHFVATGTGRRVACLVSPLDNSWATVQENPYSISIECDPRCRDEDYDVVAELIADIRSAYGDHLELHPHKEFFNTACPGNWDLARLDALSRTKVSHDPWGNVTDAVPKATADQVRQAYQEILERAADNDGLNYYLSLGWTIDQVRADLNNSTARSVLINRKNAEAAAAVQAAQPVPKAPAKDTPETTTPTPSSVVSDTAGSTPVTAPKPIPTVNVTKPQRGSWIVRFLIVLVSIFTKKK